MPINLSPSAQALFDLQLNFSIILTRIEKLESRLAAIGSIVRGLDTTFIISALRPSIVIYTLELYVPVFLGGSTSKANVELCVDGLVTHTSGTDLITGLSLGLSADPKSRKTIIGFVPAGSTVSLSTTLTGNGAVTYMYGQELLL